MADREFPESLIGREKMSDRKNAGIGRFALGVAAVALLGSVALIAPDGIGGFSSAVFAQDEEGGGKGSQGDGGQGNKGDGQKGQDNAGQGEGHGGPGEDSDGKGPQAGGPTDTGGGKPVWAQEGIPEVELGRLSVARSPDQVLDRALAEAIASLTPEMIEYYNMSLDEVIAELSLNFDNVAFIDSPLQNLALLGDLLEGGTALSDAGVTTSDTLLAAMLLGAASDKTISISVDTVIAVTTILGTPVTGTAAAELANLAEAIRVAILAGHG
ncbi:hypothetical protein [Rhodobacter sp. SY28-1]|uniref:hypothetical protein n=1 Tax=Rhodobacter sp. SY28-1 TaxID=2562317 RepID=UPI001485BCDA|nr:hypothetical protein [Rhodobacter sp. SY28-1]